MAPVSAIRKLRRLSSGIFFGLALGWLASAGPAQSECRGVYSKMCTPDTGSGGGGNDVPGVYYPSPEEIANAQAMELYELGEAAFNQHDFREAIRLYDLALQAGPNDANKANILLSLGIAHNDLGVEFYDKRDWREALKWFRLAQEYYSSQVNIDNVANAKAQIERQAREEREAEERRNAEIAAQEAARVEAQRQAEERRIAEIAAQEAARLAAENAAREEAQRQANLAAVQRRNSELLANLGDELAAQTGDGNSTSLNDDFVFMTGTTMSAAVGNDSCPPSQDASVVDLCFFETIDLNTGHFESGVELRPEEKKRNGSMIALVQKEGWSKKEQDRLDRALRNLPMDSTPDDGRVRQVWNDMQARGPGSGPAQVAASGDGPLLYRPGQQAHQDCTLYALASAAGLPYGVVAARAGELLRQSEWRSSAERDNPQQVFDESGGLYSGEVAILAEAFGQAEIIPPSDFSKTLKEGRPVIVGVGVAGGGHEVVLSKTFEHEGETWYEMMDSNQEDPLRRLYLSAAELDGILLDNGLAFRPEPGRTPELLR